MRHTSYRNLLWIAALVAGSGIAAPAQQTATSPPVQQLSTAASGSARQTAERRLETAGMVPDSTSLLPVAAVVGFSFLLGGIVCGTIKKRP